MKFDDDFKKALSQLPPGEKDKLILRLLRPRPDVADRLRFELLSPCSVEDRRKEVEALIGERTARMIERYYSPGYLLMDLRELSGEINGHVSVTRDKVGEPALHLLMLNKVLTGLNDRIARAKAAKSDTFCRYIVARTFRILIQIRSLDEDWFVDFKEGLKELGGLFGQNPALMNAAIHHGLNTGWLAGSDKIPEDVAKIHKELRAREALK